MHVCEPISCTSHSLVLRLKSYAEVTLMSVLGIPLQVVARHLFRVYRWMCASKYTGVITGILHKIALPSLWAVNCTYMYFHRGVHTHCWVEKLSRCDPLFFLFPVLSPCELLPTHFPSHVGIAGWLWISIAVWGGPPSQCVRVTGHLD